MFALDERLRLHGLAPVFEAEASRREHDHEHDVADHRREPRAAAIHHRQRPGATIPAPAAAARSTRSVTALSN